MKRCFSVLLSGCLLLALCACGASRRIVGTWENDGTWEIQGEQVPYGGSNTLTFNKDGTGSMASVTPEGSPGPSKDFTYSLTDDVLTLVSGEVTAEIGYTLEDDTLTIAIYDDYSGVYTRVE